jgi:hypothetical protein
VLVSNLGLTAFVKHLVKIIKQGTAVCPQGRKKKKKGTETSKVNWLNRFCSLPSGNRGKKTISVFSSLPQQSPLFFHKKIHMLHRIYRGTKVYLISYPSPHLPLGYFDGVIFKLQAFSW